MKVHFETMGTDDAQHLETVEMDAVPRVGEHVLMRGEKYGGERRNTCGESLTIFEVTDVYHEVEDGNAMTTVVLRLDEQDEQAAIFRPRCQCKGSERVPDERDRERCDNCGGLAWWRGKR